MKKGKGRILYRNLYKRCLDILLTLILIVLFTPVFLTLCVLSLITLKEAPLFSQPRGGYRGKVFRIYKLRTMTSQRDEVGELLPDEHRLNKFGKWIRKTSLDELPNFINVLKGDMSLIGPRPLVEEYLALYTPEQFRRHDALPGITGWAQINGRNAISWEEKFKLDVWYVDNLSFKLDIKILLLTLFKVMRCADISEQGQATVSLFTGGTQSSLHGFQTSVALTNPAVEQSNP